MTVSTVSVPFLMLADTSAAQTGQTMGAMLAVIATLAGVWKCWSISRRPTTNRKCVFALMSMLLLWFLGSVLGLLRPLFGDSQATALISLLTGLLSIGLLVSALVFAIIGLSELSARKGVCVQGRSQAIWALVLAGLMVAGITFNVVRRVTGATLASKPGAAKPGEALMFSELNFRFRAPDRPWVSYDVGKINQEAKIGFMRRFPEMYFIIIAEAFGSSADINSDQLATFGKTHLEATSQSCRVVKEVPYTMNGLNGLLVDSEATLGTMKLYYQHWYVATNGYAYQLIGYSRLSDRAKLPGELRKVISGFELIDPYATPATSGAGYKTNFLSTRFPYTVTVTNSAWGPYKSLDTEFPEAEFGASQGNSCFAVVPVQLGAEKIDLDALTAGLLGVMDINFPNEELTDRKAVAEASLEGVQYDFSREVDKARFYYRLRILQGGSNAYLIAAWTLRPQPRAEALLEECMNRVRFSPGPIPLLLGTEQPSRRELKTRSDVMNRAGLYYYASAEYEKALGLFRIAFACSSEETVYLANTFQAWSHLDTPTAALEFLDVQKASLLKIPDIRAWQAWFQAEASLADHAITNYATLFADGYRDEEHFDRYITILNSERQFDRALTEIHNYLTKQESLTTRLLEADTYREKGDLPKALEGLKELRQKSPFNVQVAIQFVETSLQAELFKDALDVSTDMLRNNRDSAYWHLLKGRSELGLKWYREAKASFETAAKLAPADKTISFYLDHASGLLGEGSNSMLKEPIEPVHVPASLTNGLASASNGYGSSYGAYFIRHILALSWEPGKERKSTDYFLARVLDPAGVAAFSTFQQTFDPLSEQIFVNDLRVLDSSGQLISSGKVADYYVLDQPSDNIATQRKVLNIPVAGLRPGCQIALTISRRELGSSEEFTFLEHTFSRAFPVRESIVFLRGDAARLKYHAPGLKPQKLPEGLCWRTLDPLIVRYEPLQPPIGKFSPMLWITDASARWPNLVTDYLGLIKDRLAHDPQVQTLARELVADIENTEAKAIALTRFAQTNLTYKAIEFGRRALVPNRPGEILRNKYGDCKDHALLLQQMLLAANIPADLALVNFNSLIQTNLPSLDQFDHLIVHALLPQGSIFIDATDKGSDAGRCVPLGLAGRDALILNSDKPRFLKIPDYPKNASGIEVRRRVNLTNSTDAVVEETVTFTGIHGAYLRSLLQRIPAASRVSLFQSYTSLADLEFSRFHVEALELPGAPLRLQYRYVLKKQFHRSGDRLSGILRASIERTYLSTSPVDKRLTPFELTIHLTVRSTTEIEVPDNSLAKAPGPLSVQVDPRFADCHAEWNPSAKQLKLDFRYQQFIGQFEPADYTAYREALAHGLSLIEREISLAPSKSAGSR